MSYDKKIKIDICSKEEKNSLRQASNIEGQDIKTNTLNKPHTSSMPLKVGNVEHKDKERYSAIQTV